MDEHYGPGQPMNAADVAALLAERDRLRAVVEADDGPVAKTMEYLGRVEAERDRLRAVVEAFHDTSRVDANGVPADCDLPAPQLTRRVEEAEAERDRLRAVVEDPDGALEAMHRRLDESMSEQAMLVAERDGLRAVVDAVRVMWDNIVGTADEAVIGFPVADYHAIEEALDQLDGSADMGGGPPVPRPDDPSAAPWSASIVRVGDDRVIRLHVGNFTTVLSALEAHKFGSALHAASGIDTAGRDRQRVGQQYLSNACIHDQHDQCDEECIYCHDGCACSCHPWNAELAANETEPSHHVPHPETRGDELVGMALRGFARPVQPAGGPPDAVRSEGVEREALEGEHAPEPTQRPDED